MNYLDSQDNVKYSLKLTGLNEEVVKKISHENNEPNWMLEHRLNSLKIFLSKPMPTWGPDLSDIDFDKIVYFAKPENTDEYAQSREDVPQEMKDKFEKLGIPEAERKYLAGAGGQFDSEIVYHKIKEKRNKMGIIFEDMNKALKTQEQLVKKYFMKLVPPNDHKFAALHGAVWSGGTFIYMPKGTKIDQPLQTYFRMNVASGGQFEHTLIILEDDCDGSYIEGCSAPKLNQRALHAGCVELFIGKNSTLRYSSVENWSINTYNLNTKRAILENNAYIEWVGGNFGSGISMLYPMSILKGDNSKADHLGVAFAGAKQIQDIGSKIVHIGKNTSSKIISKSICKGGGINTYRGLVKISSSATGAINSTNCDAILIDDRSVSNTIPNIQNQCTNANIAHEASAGKIDENILFYMTSRGIDKDTGAGLLINGFVNPIIKKLPLEYAGELNRLIEIEMTGNIG